MSREIVYFFRMAAYKTNTVCNLYPDKWIINYIKIEWWDKVLGMTMMLKFLWFHELVANASGRAESFP